MRLLPSVPWDLTANFMRVRKSVGKRSFWGGSRQTNRGGSLRHLNYFEIQHSSAKKNLHCMLFTVDYIFFKNFGSRYCLDLIAVSPASLTISCQYKKAIFATKGYF